MKHRTADLEGALLDAAVALAENEAEEGSWQEWGARPYSSDWHWCGPIIERERIGVVYGAQIQPAGSEWVAVRGFIEPVECAGPTPLVAAMRCYVVSELGEEVDLP